MPYFRVRTPKVGDCKLLSRKEYSVHSWDLWLYCDRVTGVLIGEDSLQAYTNPVEAKRNG